MKKYLISAVVLFLSFTACKNDDTPPLSKEKMEAVLLEMQIAEAYSAKVPMTAEYERLQSRKNLDTLARYQAMIITKHGISQQSFEEAYDWYLRHPEQLDVILASIITKATAWKSQYASSSDMAVDPSIAHETAVDTTQTDSTQINAPSVPEAPEIEKPQSKPDDNFDELDRAEMEAIKAKNKAQKAALDKVKKEN